MAPLLRRRRVLAAKIEATPGTAEVLAAGDGAFNVYNALMQPGIDMAQRERQGGFAMLPAISGQHVGTVTFSTELDWDGTATLPSWAETFLPACGWVKSGTSYLPTDEPPGANVKTLTIGSYVDGMYKELKGCSGNFELVFPTGRAIMFNWTFQGVWTDPSDVALLTPTYPTTAPWKYSLAPTTFNGNDLCLEQLAINAGNAVVAKMCADNAAGVDYFLIANRQTTAVGSPEAALVATTNHYGNLTAHTQGELSVEVTGGTGNDTFTALMSAAQIQSIAEGDREGIVVDDITWQANYHATDICTLAFATVA